jgi:ParB-like chromosome segregation protein Spo0J
MNAPKAALPPSAITLIALSDIKPYWRNPRKTDAAVQFVADAITRYGFNVPLVLDPAHVILAGHVRYRAALHLGLAEVPCLILDLTPNKARQFRIADNKVAELASWDTEKLTSELLDMGELEKVADLFNTPEWTALKTAVFDSAESDGDDPAQTKVAPYVPLADEPEATPPLHYKVICPHCAHESTLTEGPNPA